ncbi:MAG: DUF5591 domain-containing protein [Thermoplasmata archaeon]
MIEIIERWGLSKKGYWEFDENKIDTPNILFLKGVNFEPPEFAEATISDSEESTLQIPSSIFESGERFNSVPSTFGYPQEIDDDYTRAKGGNEKIQVIYDQEPDHEAELYIIGNAPQLLKRTPLLVDKIINLRKKIPFHKLIYTPGIAQPNNIALLAYLGVDLFDSAFIEYMNLDRIELTDWIGFPGDHERSYRNLHDELRLLRNAIDKKGVRELVESRVRSEPWMVEALRKTDKEYDLFKNKVPVTGDRVNVTTREGLNRPDIKRFRERIKNRYRPPERDILLLLPCSAYKPYFQSRTHKRIREATSSADWTKIHDLMLTSPLGAVPREIEQFYPAQQYDIPVSHQWFSDEKEIILELLNSIIEKGNYKHIISHLPKDMDFVLEKIDVIDTIQGDYPTDNSSIDRLKDTLKEYCGEGRGDRSKFLKENLRSFSRFQFGEKGEKLVDGAYIRGRYPDYKIVDDQHQRGMIVSKRGLISLTLHGAEILQKENIFQAEIDDFQPKGSVFAVGVEDADPHIAPEDEVIVVHDGELRGVGPATMSGEEMKEAEAGEAVRLRHHS